MSPASQGSAAGRRESTYIWRVPTLESGDEVPEQTALLVPGSKQSAPNAADLLDDVHLPRLAADGAILDERLMLPAFFVDVQLDRFAAVGTACRDGFDHRLSGRKPNDLDSGAPSMRR